MIDFSREPATLFLLLILFPLDNTGVGGYTYLLEPLWWAGMVTSKFSNNSPIYFRFLSLPHGPLKLLLRNINCSHMIY